jgi:hypothetical protein
VSLLSAQGYINNAINNTVNGVVELFYWNKKEAITLLQNNGLQLSKTLPQDGFVHSIHDNGSNVKTKIKNIMETRQFKNWFGDWQNNPKKASIICSERYLGYVNTYTANIKSKKTIILYIFIFSIELSDNNYSIFLFIYAIYCRCNEIKQATLPILKIF